jgi:hypothetical protein
MNPLYTSKALGRTIDLSQLSELSNAYFFQDSPDYDSENPRTDYWVAFQYRLGGSDAITYQRRLRIGPPREGTLKDHTLSDPTAQLLTVGEEMYRIHPPANSIRSSELFVILNGDGLPIAMDNLNKDVASLLSAWSAWKDYLNEHHRQSQVPAGSLRPLPPV